MIHESTSDLPIRTITGINGSSGFGSVKRELIDWSTFDIFRAGLNEFSEYLRKCFHFILYYSIGFSNNNHINFTLA